MQVLITTLFHRSIQAVENVQLVCKFQWNLCIPRTSDVMMGAEQSFNEEETPK